MCTYRNPNEPRKARGGFLGAVIKDFAQAKNPTFNPVKRTIDNWSPNAPFDPKAPQPAAPVNPMGVAMAGKAASVAGATQSTVKPRSIADSFLGATDTASQKPQSGYKVVG
jgi:hypothetical protein